MWIPQKSDCQTWKPTFTASQIGGSRCRGATGTRQAFPRLVRSWRGSLSFLSPLGLFLDGTRTKGKRSKTVMNQTSNFFHGWDLDVFSEFSRCASTKGLWGVVLFTSPGTVLVVPPVTGCEGYPVGKNCVSQWIKMSAGTRLIKRYPFPKLPTAKRKQYCWNLLGGFPPTCNTYKSEIVFCYKSGWQIQHELTTLNNFQALGYFKLQCSSSIFTGKADNLMSGYYMICHLSSSRSESTISKPNFMGNFKLQQKTKDPHNNQLSPS